MLKSIFHSSLPLHPPHPQPVDPGQNTPALSPWHPGRDPPIMLIIFTYYAMLHCSKIYLLCLN